jgi:hypothetical protein
MKKSLLLLMIAAVYCCSCTKDGIDASSYYIKAKFNGEEKKFSNSPAASEYSGDITAGFSMSAKNNSANTSFSLNIIHPFGVKLTEGVYKEVSGGYIPDGGYVIADTIFYASGFEQTSSTVQIIISNLTGTTVSGTFSGTFYNTANVNDSISITNGSFKLPVQQ